MEPLRAEDPRTVGSYVLIARLGSGGMGQVFLGRTRGGRTVAVKVVKAELAGDHEFRRRFRQEVAAARLVSGRYTAAVVDADPDAAMPWLATVYVSGLTLRAVGAAGVVLPEDSLRVLAYGLARALAEIHSAGVVHRDLKPSNVMLAVDGPHVIDFGISRVLAASDFTRTDVGTVIGSPGFMSPEQSQGGALTAATDVFSLGTVLAYAATGHNPFGRGPDHTLLYRIAHGEPDLSGVPDSLAPLIGMCLAKDPEQRPSTAQIIGRMADVPREGAWLPADLTAAIAQSAAEILDYEGIAVFAEPDVDPVAVPVPGVPAPAADPTLVLPTSADRPTALLGEAGKAGKAGKAGVAGVAGVAASGSGAGDRPGGTRKTAGVGVVGGVGDDRSQERVGVGLPPEGGHGGRGAGLVAGVLSVAVIAALATALVLVLSHGSHSPETPPAASVGTSTSQSQLARSVSAPPSSVPSATASASASTASSPPMPTTPVSTSDSSSAPSTTQSSTHSTTTSSSTQSSSSASSAPSSSASSSAPSSSSPSTTHSTSAASAPSSAHS